MSHHVRTAARLVGVVALAVLLTGCIKLNMNLGINADDTVSGTVIFGVQKELLDLTGQNVEDLLGSEAPFPTGATGVTVEPYDDGDFAGQQIIFEDVPFDEFNSQAASGATGPGESLSITRQGDTFVVNGVLDLSGGLSGATGPFGATASQQLLESADISIAITFPGDVIDATGGEIDNNTVTYRPRFGQRLEIHATGSAVDDGDAADVVGGSDDFNPLIVLFIVGGVILLGLIVFLVIRSRRRGGPPSADNGFEPAAPATPEMAPPPPGAPSDQPPAAPPTSLPPPAGPPPAPPEQP